MARTLIALTLAALCALPALPASAAYPGANGELYFASRRGTTHLCIWSIDPADGTTVKMTGGVNGPKEDWTPYWSPDGTKLLFQSDRDGDIEIFLFDSTTSVVTQLTRNTVEDQYASWSPVMADGRLYILFQRRSKTGGNDLWVMNENGSGQRQLYASKKDDHQAAWSPLGNEVAFTSAKDGDADVYLLSVSLSSGVVSAVGTPRNMTSHSAGADFSPDFAPSAPSCCSSGTPGRGSRPWATRTSGGCGRTAAARRSSSTTS